MRRIIALTLLLFIAGTASAHARPDQLAEIIEAASAGKTVPAMGIVEIRNGRVVGVSVAGVRRIDRADPIRLNDRWLLGSDSKAFTATLIGRLVDKGVLSWTTRLDRMLPELADEMRPEYRDVTLADLLSHRSGLPTDVDDLEFYKQFFNDRRSLPEQRLEYVRRALKDAPVGPARDKDNYSNSGIVLAAVIAERAANKPYETLLMENVFRPLGMRTAGFGGATDGAVGHVDGRPALETFDPNPPMINPSNGVQLSLDDWAKFCVDQMNGYQGHGRLLRPETYRFLQTAQGSTHAALGWMAQPTVYGRGPALFHTGSDGNWFAVAILYPKAGDGVLVVANSAFSMGGNTAAEAAARAVIQDFPAPAATS